MYDLEKEFETFYKDYVVLSSEKQQELRNKKDINITHLKNGLAEINEENGTSYAVAETRVQGSMAMCTVVQNDENDYDIDVAIVFDKSNIGTKNPLQTRRLVCDALKKKCGQLKNEPECKTNCVRVEYADGYHVDFAVYRRFKEDGESTYSYEHAGGNNWTSRDPKAITKWFQDEVKEKGKPLRKVVRLSKMFCKSRSGWVNMPGGLIQSVVCDEVYAEDYDRLDEIFYYTMKNVRDRLNESIEVYNPTDSTLSLLSAQNHYDKMNNWLVRLDSKLNDLEIIESNDCTYEDVVDAWRKFFNHDYWDGIQQNQKNIYEMASVRKSAFSYQDTEEFIEDHVSAVNDIYNVRISCQIEANGVHVQPLYTFLKKFPIYHNLVPKGLSLTFEASTDAPYPYEIWWKVRNVGSNAERKNDIRGQIEKQWHKTKHENSEFGGPHFVECYIIKDGECVAWKRLGVSIGEASV